MVLVPESHYRDSNAEPSDPESDALSVELQRDTCTADDVRSWVPIVAMCRLLVPLRGFEPRARRVEIGCSVP